MKSANELLMRPTDPGDSGEVIAVGPEQAGWNYIGLEIRRIGEGETWSFSSPDDELCLVPIVGSGVVAIGEERWTISRPGTVFDGKPTAL